jgi:hypothetical protein
MPSGMDASYINTYGVDMAEPGLRGHTRESCRQS